MLCRKYSLKEINDRLPESESFGSLKTYCRSSGSNRPAVLILPGGGIAVRSPGEAEPVALEFVARGMQAFVLEYSLVPAVWPQQMLEVMAALKFIRENAAEFRVDPQRVAVMGFSAGGFLAGAAANHWHDSEWEEAFDCEMGLLRPDAVVLSYPVITTERPTRFAGNTTMTHDNLGVTELRGMQLDMSVSVFNPPTFIWHTFDDEMVPVENSLRYAAALRRVNVPFELHIYPHGPHAMGTCTEESAWRPEGVNPHAASWIDLCAEWLEQTM